jgi:phosphoribosylformylglycinamidine cyclo-ligase
MTSITYKDAGVNIDEGNKAVQLIKKHLKSTFNSRIPMDIGFFGGAIRINEFKKMSKPLLISSIDGVGTKLKIAFLMNKWDTVGIDLVNHCANDILCHGAKPLFFLDYIAMSHLSAEKVEQIVKGIAIACKNLEIPLIGGETAEMPGVYLKNEIDLVGCIVGIVDENNLITGKNVCENDVLIGLKSNGLHTNGFSLARKVFFEKSKMNVNDFVKEFNCSLGEELLKPHKSYVKSVFKVMKKVKVKGIAHITGGGLIENLARILPKNFNAVIEKKLINVLPVFKKIQVLGSVPEQDMWRTFNMGVGMVLIVEKENSNTVLKILKNEAFVLGKIVKGNGIVVLK